MIQSGQAGSLIDLLDRTPSPDDNISQFVNNTDNFQQLPSNQIFSFPSSSITDASSKMAQTVKRSTTSTQSTLECHQSTETKNRSESADLDMDDPLQSPPLASSLAFLKDRDLIPSATSGKSSTPGIHCQSFRSFL